MKYELKISCSCGHVFYHSPAPIISCICGMRLLSSEYFENSSYVNKAVTVLSKLGFSPEEVTVACKNREFLDDQSMIKYVVKYYEDIRSRKNS